MHYPTGVTRELRLPISAREAAQAIAAAARAGHGDEGLELVSPEIAAISPYRSPTPPRELAASLGVAQDELLMLAANENALGPSPRAVEAAQAALFEAHRFPDSAQVDLRRALADRHGVSPEHVVVGNGSCEIVELLVRTFLGPGQTMVTAWPSYVVYRLAAQAAGREVLIAPLRQGRYDLAALAALVDARTQLVFIANPNNPTGTYVPRRELAAFLGRIPRAVITVIDEAYVDFADAEDCPDAIRDFGHHPNLVVLRTFSKVFGLAGLRVGYAVLDPRLGRYLERVRAPHNVNAVAQVAARVALEDEAHWRASRRTVREGRALLTRGLERLGLTVTASQANFLMVNLGCEAKPVVDGLRGQGVVVRDLAPYDLPDTLRVTVGTKAQNLALLEALESRLGGA